MEDSNTFILLGDQVVVVVVVVIVIIIIIVVVVAVVVVIIIIVVVVAVVVVIIIIIAAVVIIIIIFVVVIIIIIAAVVIIIAVIIIIIVVVVIIIIIVVVVIIIIAVVVIIIIIVVVVIIIIIAAVVIIIAVIIIIIVVVVIIIIIVVVVIIIIAVVVVVAAAVVIIIIIVVVVVVYLFVLQLICAGMDHQSVPQDLGAKFGDSVKRLDFSYNQLRFVLFLDFTRELIDQLNCRAISYLDRFSHLTELVLDNNVITDEGFDLPQMPHLELLSVNKNKVNNNNKCVGATSIYKFLVRGLGGSALPGEGPLSQSPVPESPGEHGLPLRAPGGRGGRERLPEIQVIKCGTSGRGVIIVSLGTSCCSRCLSSGSWTRGV